MTKGRYGYPVELVCRHFFKGQLELCTCPKPVTADSPVSPELLEDLKKRKLVFNVALAEAQTNFLAGVEVGRQVVNPFYEKDADSVKGQEVVERKAVGSLIKKGPTGEPLAVRCYNMGGPRKDTKEEFFCDCKQEPNGSFTLSGRAQKLQEEGKLSFDNKVLFAQIAALQPVAEGVMLANMYLLSGPREFDPVVWDRMGCTDLRVGIQPS